MKIKTIKLPFEFKKVNSQFQLENGSYYGMDHYEDIFAFALVNTIAIYKDFKKIHEIKREKASRVKFYNRGDHLVALIDYFGIVIYETTTFTQVKEFNVDLNGNNWSCCLTDDEKYYICSGNSGRVIILDLLKLEIVFQKHLHKDRVMGISVNGYELLTSSYDGFIQKIDLHKMDVIENIDFKAPLSSVLNCGDYFYTSSSNDLMKCDRSGKILENYSLDGVNAWCIQKLGFDYLIFISWNRKMLRIFDIHKKKIIFEENFTNSIWELHLTNDRAIICSDIGTNGSMPEYKYRIQPPALKLRDERMSKLFDVHFFYH